MNILNTNLGNYFRSFKKVGLETDKKDESQENNKDNNPSNAAAGDLKPLENQLEYIENYNAVLNQLQVQYNPLYEDKIIDNKTKEISSMPDNVIPVTTVIPENSQKEQLVLGENIVVSDSYLNESQPGSIYSSAGIEPVFLETTVNEGLKEHVPSNEDIEAPEHSSSEALSEFGFSYAEILKYFEYGSFIERKGNIESLGHAYIMKDDIIIDGKKINTIKDLMEATGKSEAYYNSIINKVMAKLFNDTDSETLTQLKNTAYEFIQNYTDRLEFLYTDLLTEMKKYIEEA